MKRPLTVLVVEDNPLNRHLLCVILAHNGHRFIEAGDVGEARSRIAAEEFDLAVLDLQVPGGGGATLLAEIRGTPHLAHLPVVVVTASAMHGDRERLLAAGFDAYFSKPIDTRRIASDLEAVVAAKGRSVP